MSERPERLFLAVALTDEARHGLAARLQDRLAGDRLPGRAVAIGNWHLTLRFLGLATPMERDAVLAHLDQHVQAAPFRIRWGGLGAFPRASRASILWIGVTTGADSLASLAGESEEAARAAGFEPEGRPFHPHLTISRMRPPENVRTLLDGESLGIAMDVTAVTLYRSILGGNRPAEYEAIEVVDL
jgi:2'-5' RNA ligase